MTSDIHPQESTRLMLLNQTGILDTEPERLYDDFVALAATICEMPYAGISFLDQGRLWFKARYGFEAQQTCRDTSLASQVILSEKPTIVHDVRNDPRTSVNPLFCELKIRSYVGVPLTVEGMPIGVLAVLDTRAHRLSKYQVKGLEILARQISVCLESRWESTQLQERAATLEAAEARLSMSQRRMEYLFQHQAVATYTTDVEGTVFEFNSLAEELFGWFAHEIIGQHESLLLPPEEQEQARDVRANVSVGTPVHNCERRIQRSDGLQVWTLFSAHPVYDSHGDINGIINVCSDITVRKRLEAELSEMNTKLEALASTDALTQVANRRSIMDFLDGEFASRHRYPVSAVLMDVDKFKQFNDTYGHPAGDEVLRTVARVLQSNVRTGDRVGRYGGEEFVCVLPRTELVDAVMVAERLRAALEAFPWPLRLVTASIGVAISTPEMEDMGQLISLADTRLYAAKEGGRNRVVSESDPASEAA